MNEKLASAKAFVNRHKVAFTAIGTAAVCTYVHVRTVAGYNEFLQEHNLLDLFYTPEDEEMGE